MASLDMIFPMRPVQLPIVMFRNDNPWRHRFNPGQDIYGGYIHFPDNATARMQVRLYDGAPGAALLDAVMDVTSWIITAEISRAAIAALPVLGEAGFPSVLRYDVLLTIPTIGENVAFYGDVVLHHGVTR